MAKGRKGEEEEGPEAADEEEVLLWLPVLWLPVAVVEEEAVDDDDGDDAPAEDAEPGA